MTDKIRYLNDRINYRGFVEMLLKYEFQKYKDKVGRSYNYEQFYPFNNENSDWWSDQEPYNPWGNDAPKK